MRRSPLGGRSNRGGMAGQTDVLARFPLREPHQRPSGAVIAAACACVVVLLAAALAHGVASLVLLVGGLALGGLCVLAALRGKARVSGAVCLYSWGVTREDDQGSVRLVAFGEPLGVSLLADHSRTHALLAFTTPTHTRYASVHTTDAPPALLSRATTIAESDAAALSTPFALSGADALMILRLIEASAPLATERLFLTGSHGERIALEKNEIRVETVRDTGPRSRVVDLAAPLEWRGFMFHESIGPVTTLYQATWVKQGAGEIVFVAPMPHVLASHADRRHDLPDHDVAHVVRDLRLMQSLPEAPPPRELRTAIERAFMLPLRQALDRAPRAERSAPPTRLQSSPEGRL